MQVREYLNYHLQMGKYADAAKACVDKVGLLRLRVFIDGRRDTGNTNVVIATVKIQGHLGSDVEITLAIVIMKEDRGKRSAVMSAYTSLLTFDTLNPSAILKPSFC